MAVFKHASQGAAGEAYKCKGHLDGGCSRLACKDALGYCIHSSCHFWQGLVGWQALAQGWELSQPGIQDGSLLRMHS